MRLLTKSELDEARAKQRKLEIDEGMKLAKHVDKLRVTIAEDQKTLGQFAASNKQLLLKEIEDLVSKRGELRTELVTLHEERNRLLEPLDERERELTERSQRLTDREENLLAREREYTGEKIALDTLRREAEGDATRSRENVARTEKLHTEALVRLRTLEQDKKQHETQAETRTKALDLRERLLEQRITALDKREERLAERAKQLDARERQQNDRERQLEDIYQTSIRNKQRGERSKGRK